MKNVECWDADEIDEYEVDIKAIKNKTRTANIKKSRTLAILKEKERVLSEELKENILRNENNQMKRMRKKFAKFEFGCNKQELFNKKLDEVLETEGFELIKKYYKGENKIMASKVVRDYTHNHTSCLCELKNEEIQMIKVIEQCGDGLDKVYHVMRVDDCMSYYLIITEEHIIDETNLILRPFNDKYRVLVYGTGCLYKYLDVSMHYGSVVLGEVFDRYLSEKGLNDDGGYYEESE